MKMLDIEEKTGEIGYDAQLRAKMYYSITLNGKLFRELMKVLKEHKKGLYTQFKKELGDSINFIVDNKEKMK